MPEDKLILDIRFYESEKPNVDGDSLPGDPGRIFRLPGSIHAVGARIARKLRELEFRTGTFDHVYVNLTTAIPEGRIAFSPRTPHRETARLRYVDYGANPKAVNRLGEQGKERFAATAAFDVLRFIAGKKSGELAKIEQVGHLIAEYGSELPILHRSKETKTCLVRVSYTIAPHPMASTGWVEYIDKNSGKAFRGSFVKLQFYEDIFFLVSSIAITKGRIVFKPRSSFKASLYNKRYQVPLSIELDNLEPAQP